MDHKKNFNDELAQARAIVDGVKAEGRESLTDDEDRKVRKHMKAARDAQLSGVLDDLAGYGGGDVRPAKKLSSLLKDKLREMGAKDLTTTPSAIVGVDFIGSPGALQGVVGARVFGAFPQRRVDGGSVRFLRQTQSGAAVPAAVVAPGAAKPVATWNVENVDEDLPTIAIISPDLANSVLRDSGGDLEQFLDQQLSAEVYRELDQLAFTSLNTAATAASNTQAFATSPQVTLRKAVTQLEQDGFEATHVFVNPSDHEALALATDSQGQYLFAGPTDANVPRAWSMTLVSSPGVTAGIAIVTAAPVAAIGVLRQDVELSVDTISGFTTNESRVRAEMRALLAVTTPNAVVSADVSA